MAALPLIVFDVNETLLDLETMEPVFQRIFGDKNAMRLWFANPATHVPRSRRPRSWSNGRNTAHDWNGPRRRHQIN
jgi:hypothetical protein